MESKPVLASCTNCGGEFLVPADLEALDCLYCSTRILFRNSREVTDRKPQSNISDTLMLARKAEKDKDFAFGYKYYSQIIESNIENSTAWLGKARCAAWGGSDHDSIKEAIYLLTAGSIIGRPGKAQIRKNIKALYQAIDSDREDFVNSLIDHSREDKDFIFSPYKEWVRYLIEQVNTKFNDALVFQWETNPSENAATTIIYIIETLWNQSKLDYDYFLFPIIHIAQKYPDKSKKLIKKFITLRKKKYPSNLVLRKLAIYFEDCNRFFIRLRLYYKWRDYLLEKNMLPTPKLPKWVIDNPFLLRCLRLTYLIQFTRSWIKLIH